MHQLKFTSATILMQDTGSARLFAAGLSSHSELPIYRIVKRKTNLNCSSMDDSFGPTPCKPLVGSSSDLGIKRLAQQKPELGQK